MKLVRRVYKHQEEPISAVDFGYTYAFTNTIIPDLWAGDILTATTAAMPFYEPQERVELQPNGDVLHIPIIDWALRRTNEAI